MLDRIDVVTWFAELMPNWRVGASVALSLVPAVFAVKAIDDGSLAALAATMIVGTAIVVGMRWNERSRR